MTRRLLATAVVVLGLLVFTSTAGAETLGVTAPPSGSTSSNCGPGDVVGQLSDDPSTPYLIPTGGGEITQWQTNTAGDTEGSTITLAVLKPTGITGQYTEVAIDAEKLPTPLPSNNIASFTLAQPLQVAAGDTLALYSTSAIYACYFHGGTVPANDVLFAASPTLPLTAGETVTQTGPSSGGTYTLNVAATLIQSVDAGVSTSTFPATIDGSGAALLQSVVTNNGPAAGRITLVDQVPSGLKILSATVGAEACAVSGQTVTCTINGLAPGLSTTVDVLVSASATGSYANSVSVSVGSGLIDPTSSNNTASANLMVTALPQQCIVPGAMRKLPQAVATTLLTELGCKVRVVKKHSSIRKGLLISVPGGAHTYPYKQVITIDVSSGPKAKKKHH